MYYTSMDSDLNSALLLRYLVLLFIRCRLTCCAGWNRMRRLLRRSVVQHQVSYSCWLIHQDMSRFAQESCLFFGWKICWRLEPRPCRLSTCLRHGLAQNRSLKNSWFTFPNSASNLKRYFWNSFLFNIYWYISLPILKTGPARGSYHWRGLFLHMSQRCTTKKQIIPSPSISSSWWRRSKGQISTKDGPYRCWNPSNQRQLWKLLSGPHTCGHAGRTHPRSRYRRHQLENAHGGSTYIKTRRRVFYQVYNHQFKHFVNYNLIISFFS